METTRPVECDTLRARTCVMVNRQSDSQTVGQSDTLDGQTVRHVGQPDSQTLE